VAHIIFSIIPYVVRVEASFSIGRDVIGWRQSKTTRETLREKVIVRRFSQANIRILAGTDPDLDNANTENDLEMKTESSESKLHRMAKVHNFLEMWQGSQDLSATQKESRAQNKHKTTTGYILDTEAIVIASWFLFQYNGAAAFKLSERSPMPLPLAAEDLPKGRTQILNVRRIWSINQHPVKSDEDSAPESILDNEDLLNWNGDIDNSNNREDDYTAVFESDMDEDYFIEDLESQKQQNVSAMPNVSRLIRPLLKSKRHAERVLVMVNGMET
jgi:hypothetical protein